MEDGLESMAVTSITMIRILTESTASIYEKDSVELGKPIFIRQLAISFTDNTTSSELRFDSIEATYGKDSILNFQKITIMGDNILYNKEDIMPIHNYYLGKDSVKLAVKCEYLPNMNIIGNDDFKYLKTNYVMKNRMIIKKEM